MPRHQRGVRRIHLMASVHRLAEDRFQARYLEDETLVGEGASREAAVDALALASRHAYLARDGRVARSAAPSTHGPLHVAAHDLRLGSTHLQAR